MRALASLVVLALALLVGIALGEPVEPGAAVAPWRLVYATEVEGGAASTSTSSTSRAAPRVASPACPD